MTLTLTKYYKNREIVQPKSFYLLKTGFLNIIHIASRFTLYCLFN